MKGQGSIYGCPPVIYTNLFFRMFVLKSPTDLLHSPADLRLRCKTRRSRQGERRRARRSATCAMLVCSCWAPAPSPVSPTAPGACRRLPVNVGKALDASVLLGLIYQSRAGTRGPIWPITPTTNTTISAYRIWVKTKSISDVARKKNVKFSGKKNKLFFWGILLNCARISH